MADAGPTISVCLPVRNSAATVERLINSVRPHVDEVCVFDTGSTDGTLDLLDELAAEPGATIKVEQGEWRNDYAAARMASFAMADADWITWGDDDEVFVGAASMRPFLASSSVDELYVRRVEVFDAESPVAVFHPRIVRRDVGAYWYPRIHERLTLPEGATADAIPPSLLEIIHHPLPNDGRHDHRPLVEKELARTGGDAELRSYRGRYLFDEGETEAAATEFEAIIADDSALYPQKARAAERLSMCRFRLGDAEGAREALHLHSQFAREWARIRPPVFDRIETLMALHPITAAHPVWSYLDEATLVPLKSDRQRMTETLRTARLNGIADDVWTEAMRDLRMTDEDIRAVLVAEAVAV